MHEWSECIFFTFYRRKYVKKSLNKIRPQSPKEKLRITYGAPVFAPDYSATCLAAKMWTNSQWAFYVY